MQFLVNARRMESPQVPAQVEFALAKATFQQAVQHTEPRITAMYPHAGDRALSLVIEAGSGDELQEVLTKLPLFPLLQLAIHPLTGAEQVLRTIAEMEPMLAQMGSPPAAP
jgi:muconolactone delta-isomerase